MLRSGWVSPPPVCAGVWGLPRGDTQYRTFSNHCLLDFNGATEDNRGRYTDSPAGRHPLRSNQRATSIMPPIFMSDALPAATLPIYPGLGQTQENAGLHTPWRLKLPKMYYLWHLWQSGKFPNFFEIEWHNPDDLQWLFSLYWRQQHASRAIVVVDKYSVVVTESISSGTLLLCWCRMFCAMFTVVLVELFLHKAHYLMH